MFFIDFKLCSRNMLESAATAQQRAADILAFCLLICQVLQVVEGTASVAVKLLEYYNADGKRNDGARCDFSLFRQSTCDHRFDICLDSYSSGNEFDCEYAKSQSTRTYDDLNIITFDPSDSTFFFSVEKWQNDIQLKIRVIDQDLGRDDLVAMLSKDLGFTPTSGGSPKETHTVSLLGQHDTK
ncbi:delta-like protein [Plakobranchus ocellatus]|uniref:Delta-like protein n=1 Tax=Plakobranchus ocellatus TaxID=259542 RepID=A0AAV4ALN9_9GAST|nr:delta-like protein [Plakobranchus ocellatus]